MKFLLKIIILNFFFISSVISAELNCETFSGTWEGNKKGAGYKGDTLKWVNTYTGNNYKIIVKRNN